MENEKVEKKTKVKVEKEEWKVENAELKIENTKIESCKSGIERRKEREVKLEIAIGMIIQMTITK